MKNPLKSRNWGLKLLALILAIITYHTLKTNTNTSPEPTHERSFFHYR